MSLKVQVKYAKLEYVKKFKSLRALLYSACLNIFENQVIKYILAYQLGVRSLLVLELKPLQGTNFNILPHGIQQNSLENHISSFWFTKLIEITHLNSFELKKLKGTLVHPYRQILL